MKKHLTSDQKPASCIQEKKSLESFCEKFVCDGGFWRYNYRAVLNTVLALTVKIRKSQDFLAPISGSLGDQIFHSLSEIQPQYS